MAVFNMSFDNDTLTLGFGDPATGDAVVAGIVDALKALPPNFGGKLLKVTGPTTVAGALAIGHFAAHKFGAVAMFDPKLQKFIVAISHDPDFAVGDLL